MKWLIGFGLLFSREVICHLPPGTAILRGAGAGRALRARCRNLGVWGSRILASGSRRAALPRGRILAKNRPEIPAAAKPPRDPAARSRPEIPPRDSRNPRIPDSGTRPPPAAGPMLRFCSVACVKKGARLGRCLPLGSLESPA